jgi:hypothetical protein
MACFSCSQKSAAKAYFKSVEIEKEKVCEEKESELLEMLAKMQCISKINRSPQVNSFLGELLSMINLKDYCRYDLAPIKIFTNNYANC